MSKLISIPEKDYHTLLGLKQLADQKNKELRDLDRAAAEILGVPEDESCTAYYGHVSDCIIGQMCSINQLLHRLDIDVKKEPATENPGQ